MACVLQTSGSAGAGWRWNGWVLQTFGSAGARRRWNGRGYKHSAPLEPGGDGMACVLQTFGSAGAGRRWNRWATNIRLRWSREAMEWPACYKHSAPLEAGGDGIAGLQTFGSAGAGRRWNGLRATNIRLRWSREEMEWPGLQTFGSAGAGR